jgi:hypothetical protein
VTGGKADCPVFQREKSNKQNPQEAQEEFDLVEEKPEFCRLGKGLTLNLLKPVYQ